MTYTPGPWRLKTTGNMGNCIEALAGTWEGEPRYAHVASYQYCLPAEISNYNVQEANAIANGRLIAAAPELLEALEKFVEDYTEMVNSGDCGFWDPENEDKVKAARAAIKKAKGE